MSPTHRSRRLVVGLVAVLALTVLAPGMATAEEEDVTTLAPAAAPTVEESGSSAVGATNRVLAAQRALLTGHIGSMQEERLQAIVAAAPSWDETSGYGSVEASRAANALAALPVVITNQVPSDVRWAPERTLEHVLDPLVAAAMSWDETSGYGAVEATRATIGHPAASTTDQAYRVLAAQRALLSHDLRSLQEDASTAVVEASSAGAEASVDAAPAPTSAELLAQFRAIERALSRHLGAEQAEQLEAASSHGGD